MPVRVNNADLRLSAQRALLGAISPPVRCITIAAVNNEIQFTVISARALSEHEHEALTTAAAEIIADFPDCALQENYVISTEALPRSDSADTYRVFARLE